jgi:hypothetical protein
MTLDRSYIGYLGFLGIDFLNSVLMYSKGAYLPQQTTFKNGSFYSVLATKKEDYFLFFLRFPPQSS